MSHISYSNNHMIIWDYPHNNKTLETHFTC
jgi:hypothetical protein